MTSVGVVAASAGGIETLREGLIQPLIADGHQVAVTLTPTAARWLDDLGERQRLETLTGLPVRSATRLPRKPQPHPKSDVFVGILSANSVAKLALGIADNQALTVLCECVATVPMIIFPRINAAHARQPAWSNHLDALRSAGVELIYGDHVWPLAEPRMAGPRELPWAAILAALKPHC
jgi:Flavoprotein